jgi:exosortase F-associated protein
MIKSLFARPGITWTNLSLFVLALCILALTYLFQRVDFFQSIERWVGLAPETFHPFTNFVVNKTLRLMINDLACFILIFVFFRERKYLKVAFFIFLFEIVIVLPIYFVLKLSLEGDSEISSPLLSQIHRLIVNPTLMILLIISFFYARYVKAENA